MRYAEPNLPNSKDISEINMALFKVFHVAMCNTRLIATSSISSAGEKWRLAQGLGKCGNEYGPLTDIPDWSYADGRPGPLGDREVKRRLKQKQQAETVVQLINEMKQAKRNYANKLPLEQKKGRGKVFPLASSKI